MIKKSVFENDLIAGMQHELRKMASGDPPDLVRAGECLHAALEILEDEGLQKHADRVLGLLQKIAVPTKVQMLPNLTDLGITTKDLRDFAEGNHHAKIKINSALRRFGMSDEEIKKFLGPHNFISHDNIQRYIKLLNMIKNPTVPTSSEIPREISIQSLPESPEQVEDIPSGQELTFKSIAAPRKPGRPDKIHDVHTKGLTPDKEVKNIEHHGTQFNMPDLGWSDNLDPDVAEAFDAHNIEELDVSDILDADITEDILEVSELNTLEDFEDEVSH
jgi:hypothetical protein